MAGFFAAQAILKNLGSRFHSMAKLVFGLKQSLDGYVDYLEFAPGSALGAAVGSSTIQSEAP
jgi:hypothetical protein